MGGSEPHKTQTKPQTEMKKNPQSLYEFHEIANIFPMMGEDEIADVAESIKRSGQRDDIILFEGMILDGRNREAACFVAGVTPRYRVFDMEADGADPVRYVLDKNLERRHLTSSQKAAAATDALEVMEKFARARSDANLVQNQTAADPAVTLAADVTGTGAVEPPAAAEGNGRTTDVVAKQFGTSGRQVSRAKHVKQADPEKFEEVKEGKKSLAAAESEVKAAAEDLDDPEFVESRKDAAPALQKLLGDEFATAFVNGTILKTKEATKDFLAASDDEKKLIAPYVITGWEPKRAVKFVLRAVDAKDPIEQLILRAANSGKGKFETVVNGWKITLKLEK